MPEAKIFEETKIKLRLKVTKGKATETTAKFTLLVDGAEHSTHSADLEAGAFSWPTTAPKIDDSVVKRWPYGLKYRVLHEGKLYHGAEEWQVWPKTIELKPTGNDGPAKLKVLQADKVVAAPPEIAKDGTTTTALKLTAASTVQSVFPWKIKSGGVKDKGRTRTVELEKIAYQVKFALLEDGDDAAKPIKQLVNLKSEGGKGVKGLDHMGEVLELNAKVKGVEPDKIAEAEGTVVYIKVTFSDKTKRDDPAFPRKLEAEGVTTAGDVHKGTAKLDKKGFAPFKVHLGLAGGEKCKIEIGTTDACGDEARHFITYRQLHFQISHPAGLAKPAPADFVSSYDEVKVEMKEEPVGSIAAGSGPAGAWIPGDDVATGMGRKALVIGTHNEKAFHKTSFKNKNDAAYAHFLICDFQFDAGATASHEFDLEDKYLVAGGPQVEFKLHDFEDPDDGTCAIPTSIKDGKKAMRKLSYNVASKGHKGDLTVFTVDYVNNVADGGKINFILPEKAIKDYKAGETVSIKFELHLAVGPYNGSSTKNLLLIAHRNDTTTTRPADKINQTMVHEIGHALGMVASEIAIPGIADTKAEHTRAYTRRGHQGGHCAKGIAQADYDDASKNLSGMAGTCVMYGEGGDARGRSYCDLCKKLMLPAALDKYNLEKIS